MIESGMMGLGAIGYLLQFDPLIFLRGTLDWMERCCLDPCYLSPISYKYMNITFFANHWLSNCYFYVIIQFVP